MEVISFEVIEKILIFLRYRFDGENRVFYLGF